MRLNLCSALAFLVAIVTSHAGQPLAQTSVLLIIADDIGVDVLKFNHTNNTARISTLKGRRGTGGRQVFSLSNLSTLLANGISFTNTWAAPVCSPTRATIYTGLQPWRTGVGYANHVLDDSLSDGTPTKTIANGICDDTTSRTCALFGKWHLAGGNVDPTVSFSRTPLGRGWDYYAGNLDGELESYTHWEKYTSNDHTTASDQGAKHAPNPDAIAYDKQEGVTTYATQDVVDEAKTWIAAQTGTWFATLAFNAPHAPFELPPAGTYDDAATRTAGKKGKYNAMVQSLDYYIGRLWDSGYGTDINDKLQDAIIIFVGDNGTPEDIAENTGKAKGSVFLGGVHVPLIIADGAATVAPGTDPAFLARSVLGSTEGNPVHVADLYKTIVTVVGATPSAGFGTDSYDLKEYLLGTPPFQQTILRREYNFTQKFSSACPNNCEATIGDGRYKLNYERTMMDSNWYLFDTGSDPDEAHDLYDDEVAEHTAAQTRLFNAIQGHQPSKDDPEW